LDHAIRKLLSPIEALLDTLSYKLVVGTGPVAVSSLSDLVVSWRNVEAVLGATVLMGKSTAAFDTF
jgi:hypothetical protein